MPKRSDRVVFKKHFDGNPYEGKHPLEIYDSLQWGNKPKEIIDIYAFEPLISLGYLAKLFFADGSNLKYPNNKMHLAVGATTNCIYLFPKRTTILPYYDSKKWKNLALVERTDYYSEKGQEHCYYYHDHEPPFPILAKYSGKNIYMLLPQSFNGRRSYAVIKEGIVG